MKKALNFVLLAFCIMLSDYLLKTYIHSNIAPLKYSLPIYPYGGIAVFQDWHGIQLSIVHVMNKGAAWGIFSSLQNYLLYVRIAIIGGLITYLLFNPASHFRRFSLTLIVAGAIGNVIDYFLYGHVIDMFYFLFWGYSYPVFNIADSSIFLGIVLLLGEALFSKIKSIKRAV